MLEEWFNMKPEMISLLSSSSWNSIMTGVILRHEQNSVNSGSRIHSVNESKVRSLLSDKTVWAALLNISLGDIE